MTMNIRIFYYVALFMVASKASATDVITLNKYNHPQTMEGYICSQKPGGDYVIHSERTVWNVPTHNIRKITYDNIQLDKLPKAWQNWVSEHPEEVKTIGDTKFLSLASIEMKVPSSDSVTHDGYVNADSCVVVNDAQKTITLNYVRIIEEGDFVGFLDLKEQTIDASRHSVTSIRPKEEPSDLLSGFTDEIKLRTGDIIKGRIIETIPGEKIRIKTSNGVIKSYAISDIQVRRKVRKNIKQSYIEQSPLIDTFYLNNNEKIDGVIIEQQYGDGTRSSNVIIAKTNGQQIKIDNNRIKTIYRTVNAGYKPIYKLHIDKGEVFANREKLNKAEFSDDKKSFKISSSVENKLSMTESNLLIQTLTSTNFGQVHLLKISQKDKNGNYLIYKENILTTAVPCKEQTTTDDITSLKYNVKVGTYAIYLPNENIIYVCVIK